MGRVLRVSDGEDVYILSLIGWGLFRRMFCKMFRASPFSFIPRYELGIFCVTVGFDSRKPLVVFHYADREIATMRMEAIRGMLEKGDVGKVILLGTELDHAREGIWDDEKEVARWRS